MDLKNRKIELLAPGGDVIAIKAAIFAGADAIYCGLDKFNARNRAVNINFENLQGIIRLAHEHDCQIFLTLNILITESELPSLFVLLNKLVNTNIDGVIVQDLGLFYILSKYYKSLNVHASTQTTTHNAGQLHFLSKLGATRVNFSRELSIGEIRDLTKVAQQNNLETEVFVHGSYCISFSGICYMSSVASGKSGNRGRCSQPCRDKYETTDLGKTYPLNLKDNSAFANVKELYDAGVDSLKIEGRIKEFEYVYTVVKTWRKQLDSLHHHNKLLTDNEDLYKVFNRDFSNGFLKGQIGEEMYIDDPMSFSTKHLSEQNTYATQEEKMKGQLKLYSEKEETRKLVEQELEKLSIDKIPLIITVIGKAHEVLKIRIQSPIETFEVNSEMNLQNVENENLLHRMLIKKLKAINETEYSIEKLNLEKLDDDISIPFNAINVMRNKILYVLNGSKKPHKEVAVPIIEKPEPLNSLPELAVLISSPADASLSAESSATIYFQLPDGIRNELEKCIKLFQEYPALIPWFPSVLIGEDYNAALEFLDVIKPKTIVSNNTSVAWAAREKEIKWIAGPFLNLINSFSLIALKEYFACSGAFISNELNKEQIKGIKCPENFKLYHSIFHPIVLMTSRQCLFHQVSGCEKNIINNTCIQSCEKSSNITNLKHISYQIEKSPGNYHRIFSDIHFLNTDILTDLPNVFSGFLIDLRAIKTQTKIASDKVELIKGFESLFKDEADAEAKLHQSISPTTMTQYKKGI